MKKMRYILATILIGLGALGVSALDNPQQTQATDSPLTKEVDHQGEVLNNHEARITNTENDVKDLQNHTNTPPSTTRVSVPTVNPQSSNPEPPAQSTPPITVVGYQRIVVDENNTDCRFTYSDGTIYQWRWETIEYNQGTKITHTNGSCSESDIGKIKS